MYGRAFFYFTTLPKANGHLDMIMSYPSSATYVPKVSIMTGADGVNYWGVGGVGGNVDWGLADDHDGNVATPIPYKQWICLEWMFDSINNEERVWTNGVEHPQLHITQSILSSPPTGFQGLIGMNFKGSRIGSLDTVRINFNGIVGGQTLPYDVHVDEVAISTTQIGCTK